MTPTEAISGVKEAVDRTVKNVNQKVKSRATRVSNALRNAELEVLKGQRSGRIYRKPHSRAKYQASAPGEPPARRTGALRLNWTMGQESKGENQVTAYIESNTPYAGYLENGTSRMAARPYVEKIKEKAEPEIERIMSEQY